jgi:hypothetical protein
MGGEMTDEKLMQQALDALEWEVEENKTIPALNAENSHISENSGSDR